MATIITTPSAYSSIKESVIFGLARNTDTVAEVSVNGYLKLMPSNADKVNVSQYYRGDFTIYPITGMNSVLQSTPAIDVRRIVNASIVADGVASGIVPLIYADKTPIVNRFMSDMRHRIISPGQIDELPVYVDQAAVVVCGPEKVLLDVGMSIVSLKLPAWLNTNTDIPLQFSIYLMSEDDVVLDIIHYKIINSCGVRLAWINVYGAVDYWNFEARRKAATKVTKERIYSEDGYIPVSILPETIRTVATQPLSETQTEVVGQILRSENVWKIDGDDVFPIDITSDSITSFEAEKLNAIQIEYRSKTR